MTDSPVLGRPAEIPTDPATAPLDRVPNPHPDVDYVVRFAVPEFTALCPITGQPDFAHLVIDYVPDQWMIESKSLKLFMFSFRNHSSFHEVIMKPRVAEAAWRRSSSKRKLLAPIIWTEFAMHDPVKVAFCVPLWARTLLVKLAEGA